MVAGGASKFCRTVSRTADLEEDRYGKAESKKPNIG